MTDYRDGADVYEEFEVGDFVVVRYYAGNAVRGTVTEVDNDGTTPYRVLLADPQFGGEQVWFPAYYLTIDPKGDL